MAYIACCKEISVYGVKLPVDEIIAAVENTNEYLVRLNALFSEIGFNLFTVLGQRNISGVIGEIYSQFLAAGNKYLVNNPHPDGRPDVLCVPNKEVSEYLKTCFISVGGKRIPSKSMLAPFKYGGIEIKCTIGDPVSGYKKLLRKKYKIDDFYIGFPRVEFLSNLNWWAHHTKSSHMLGLYYDFSENHAGVPQIMAGFFGVLTEDNWTKVSTGNVEHKKTSNTSLNKTGKEIMKSHPVFVVNDKRYIEALRNIGVRI
jgi:hypothetical protein